MFQVIPDNFFVPLSSQNKIAYWDCICRLFSIMENQLSFGVERDVLSDELQFYFEQTYAGAIVDEALTAADSRGKANWMLRRLEYYGWIEIETDKSYVQRVTFKDYAVRILKTMLDIESGRQIEYQGYIYTIYSLVRAPEQEHPAVILMQIEENTDLLITGLKNLSSNIKHYIDDLASHITPEQIVGTMLEDYVVNVVEKAYHRLMTSDNVSKFRPEIVNRLEERARNEDYVQKTVLELAGLNESTQEEAVESVYRILHNVIESFRNMDDILAEIDRKNTQYIRSAVNRARFLLSGNEDVRGQLKELLVGIGEEMNREHLEPGGIYEIEFLDGLLSLYSVSFLDEKSFYTPSSEKKEFHPAVLLPRESDPGLIEEKKRRLAAQRERVITTKKIDAYVAGQLAGRDSMRASQLPLETPEDLVRMIYVRLYGQRRSMGYRVEPLEGNQVHVGRVTFQDYLVIRKR